MRSSFVELFPLWGGSSYVTVLFDPELDTKSYNEYISYQRLKDELSTVESRLYIALEQYFFTNHNYSWSKEIFKHINQYIELKYIELIPDYEDKHHEIRFYFQENFVYDYFLMVDMIDEDVITVKREKFPHLRGEKNEEETI